jgi:hypothetical protein
MQIFHYKGFHGCDSKCGLEIKRHDEKITVVLTELDDNPGTSVTNMIEHLATMVYHQFLKGIPVENITWIEHYPKTSFGETFDRVFLHWNGEIFSNPKWERIKEECEECNV